MDTDAMAAKELRARNKFPPLRAQRGEGRGEVSSLVFTIDERRFNKPKHLRA